MFTYLLVIAGVYYLAQPAKEQEEKAAVLFLNDQLIKLRKTDDSHASPVIVFCVVGDTLDDVIDKWTTKRQGTTTQRSNHSRGIKYHSSLKGQQYKHSLCTNNDGVCTRRAQIHTF